MEIEITDANITKMKQLIDYCISKHSLTSVDGDVLRFDGDLLIIIDHKRGYVCYRTYKRKYEDFSHLKNEIKDIHEILNKLIDENTQIKTRLRIILVDGNNLKNIDGANLVNSFLERTKMLNKIYCLLGDKISKLELIYSPLDNHIILHVNGVFESILELIELFKWVDVTKKELEKMIILAKSTKGDS